MNYDLTLARTPKASAEDTDGSRVVDLALLMYQISEEQRLRCRRRIIALYNTQQANNT